MALKIPHKKNGIWFAFLALALLILDQFTKWLSLNVFAQKPVNMGFVKFIFITNTGSSFSMLQGFNAYLIWFSIIVIGCLLYWNEYFSRHATAYALLWVGVVGNLFDRLIWGRVIDFIDLGWWPVFNVADSCLVIGVILFIVQELIEEKKADSAKKNQAKKKGK